MTLQLLEEAQAAGLAVSVRGDKLVIRGPRRAEPVARMLLAHKQIVMAALHNSVMSDAVTTAPKTPAGVRLAKWRARHAEALAFWCAFHPAEEAMAMAWGEMVNRWHKRHGDRVAVGICAGCGTPLGEGPTLTLGGGAGVHVTTLDCVIRYGERWRGAATRALIRFGLTPPR